MEATACLVCGPIGERAYAFWRGGDPQAAGLPSFPEVASRLVHVAGVAATESRGKGVRRCPACGAQFLYTKDYEYFVTGTEDEEVLERLTPEEGARWLRDLA